MNQHVSQLLKHAVLQCKEGLIGNTKSRHQYNHLPVEVQTTYNKITVLADYLGRNIFIQ